MHISTRGDHRRDQLYCSRARGAPAVISLYVVISGGLGNQMFQAATGLALQTHLGAELHFLTHSFAADSYGRDYQLDIFPALRGLAVPTEAASGATLVTEDSVRGLPPALFANQLTGIAQTHPRLILSGYWQKEDYFGHSRELIRSLFQPEVPQDVRELGEQIRNANAIGLHVRRTDYGHHGLASFAYYKDSLAAIRREVGPQPAFCVTDEPNTCKYCLRDVKDIVHLPGNVRQPSFDFYLLSCCRHFITANSSFSWWASWLGEMGNSIIYTPTPWCLSDPNSDPAPMRWRRVSGSILHQ